MINLKKNIINLINKDKYKYIFLFTIIFIGFICGIILSNILSFNDKKIVGEVIENYFFNLKNNNINYLSNIINSILVNLTYVLLIVIFSLSSLGLILNPFILYFKSLIIGFSLGIIINIYSYKGIILGILTIFPHQIINIIMYMFLCFFGIKLSKNIIYLLFHKKTINFSLFMKKYIKLIIVSCIILIISSIYEIFLGEYFIKVFTFLLN